ncbi:MAG TPA: sulfatase [Candidatus Paceibacterota bacterium]|nr:sulfatase [Verrucomicrobiota bacterium]HSA09788.1 sulfatase [Candidatus Paceibacterota bacterium]
MKRGLTGTAALACALVLSAAAARVDGSSRKNVLFIAADDLNCRIACYGDPIAKTPNLDRLARRGVMFRRAYCQYPLCNPSRASLMTGLRPDTTRVHDLQTDFRSTLPNVVTLPQLFRQNGYFVARVGKLYHYGVPREIGTDGKDDPVSWDYKFNPIGRDKTEEANIHLLTRGGYKNTIGFAMAWLDMDGPDEDQTDAKGVTETIRLLEEQKDKPFFIALGFFRPHTPWIAPKKYFDLYPPESIKLPPRDAASEKALPDIARNIRPDDYGLSEQDLKDCVRAYYAAVSFVDAQVGRLLDSLDRLGLAKSTLIVFWSDHGFLLGEHGQWQKQLLFDPSPRTPLIVYDPAAKGNGTPCNRAVELLGIYPTVADWAGLEKPKDLQGSSLRPLLDAPTSAAWHHPAYSQVTRGKAGQRVMGYSVHTERYRYTEWDGGKAGSELYDHQADPNEFCNLARDPANEKTVRQLRNLLRRVQKPGAKAEIRGDPADPQG